MHNLKPPHRFNSMQILMRIYRIAVPAGDQGRAWGDYETSLTPSCPSSALETSLIENSVLDKMGPTNTEAGIADQSDHSFNNGQKYNRKLKLR